MTLTGIEGLERPRIRAILQRASKIGAYIGVMAGVLDSMTGNAAAATDSSTPSTFSLIAYLLGIGIIIISVLVIRLMVKYYNRMTYKNAIEHGKDEGKEELLQEQLEEELAEEEEEEEVEEEEEEEEEKDDIDYDAAMDDIDKYADTMGDEDSDQPLVENINKFVTGYKFLKPPDVAVLSLTKRFDEYEVSIALPEKRKGASKISEFIPFDSNIRKEIQEEFDGISQLNNSMVAMPEMGGMGPIITSRMDGLGKRISETFIPEGVLNNLKTIKDPIIIETNDGELLWETIHDGDDYIALKHPIGRVLKTKEEARVNDFERGEKLKFLLVANPTSDLDSTEREAEYIESILNKRAVIDKLTREEATSEAILDALSSGKYDVIHYAGHADSESEGEAVLVTANGRLPSSEIKRAITGRPYVYLNACGSGRESMEESKDYTAVSDTEGLASAFILGGAVGFMGAMWRLPDKSAAEFSVKFYEGLIDNLKVGEACRQARLELQKQNPSDITWAAFLQYGDPVQRLREKKDKEAETDDNVDEDADIEVVDEEGYENWGEDEKEEVEEEEVQLSDEEKLEQYMKWIGGGLEHIKNHKYEDAITAFDSAIGLDPERYNAWHLTGNALRELRRYNEALELYDKAIERDAMVDEIWYDMALALGAVGRFDEANDAVKIVESLKVGRVKEWLKKANELMTRGGVTDALKIYDRILRENESYPLAWYLKGVAHIELGEKQRAIQAFDNSISHAKNFSMSYHKKAEVLFGLGKNDEALENVEKSIALNPVNEDALLLKATILIDLQLNKPALEAIDQILKLNKTNADAQLRKADILRRYNKNKAALDSYDRMIRLNPENAEAWYWRSKLLNELGMKEEDEIQCYTILLELDLEDPAILKGVGSALAKKEGMDDLKLKWFDKMILYNPNSARVWVNKGTALEALSRPEEGLDAYEKALELDAENIAALSATARLYEGNDIKDKAVANYARIVKLDPDNYDALINMSKLQRETGRTVEAQKGFSKLYKVQPKNITVLWNLREIYTELGKRKNALTVSKKLMKLEPDNKDNIYAHSKLIYDLKNYPEVIKYTDMLIDKMPDDNELLIMRAEAFSNMNKLDAALESWNRLIELSPGASFSPEVPHDVEPEPEPESESEPEPDQEQEPEPEPELEPEVEDEPEAEAQEEPEPEPDRPGEG